MTNEEAIKELKYIKKQTGYADIALDMAINVLKQEPCKNVIDRQAAINIVRDMYGLARADVVRDAIEQLNGLPSSIPQPKIGYWIKVDDEEPIAYDCSECAAMVSRKYNYCPCCGAFMQEKIKLKLGLNVADQDAMMSAT